jgi:hypothetical protein
VRRSTILLQDHIIINLVYRKQFNMLRWLCDVTVCSAMKYRPVMRSLVRAYHTLTLRLSCSYLIKSWECSLAHILTLCRWTVLKHEKWYHRWTLCDVKTTLPCQFH